MLLLLFIFREKQINVESMPLLSAWDIAQIMQLLIISQMFDPDKVLEQIVLRHYHRQKDINRCILIKDVKVELIYQCDYSKKILRKNWILNFSKKTSKKRNIFTNLINIRCRVTAFNFC